MSTRCQVQVIQDCPEDETKVTLYHHTDGYPEYMIPKLAEAYALSGGGWKAGRCGKVVSYLCAADPGVFEPEEGHELHGDIQYYYRLFVMDKRDCPTWEVEISEGYGNMEVTTPRTDLKVLAEKYAKSESK